MKPHIYWTYYPKSRRGYWRVSQMPVKAWHDIVLAERWNDAHGFVMMLNRKIDAAIEAAGSNKK